MSSLQFSELITGLNTSGSNCTIETVLGKKIEPLLEISNRKTLINKEFTKRMEDFNEKIIKEKDKISEIIKKKNLKNSDILEIDNYLKYISNELLNNIPYFNKTFQQSTEVIISEAKMEIESYYDDKIRNLGFEKIIEDNSSKNLTD